MKKILSLTLAFLLLLGLVACASEPTTTVPPVDDTPAVSPDTTPETPEEDEPVVEEPVEETPDETPSEEVPAEDETPATSELETMVNTIVEGVNIEPAMMHEDISADRYWWYFGSETPLEGFEAHGYEAMISAIPLSIAIMKVPEGTDAAAVAAELEENVDARKWVCVEAESKIINQQGNYILVVLADSDMAETISANFTALFAE